MPHAVFTSSIEINAPPEVVWGALVDNEKGRVWRGADFETDWQVGSPITITAKIGSKRYRDKGSVVRAERPSLLAFEFLSRVSGLPDIPESYSLIVMRLTRTAVGTTLHVEHTVPSSPIRRGKGFEIGPESGEKHVAFYWRSTLPLLRDLIEGNDTIALRLAATPRP